jgi:hypothetical protein
VLARESIRSRELALSLTRMSEPLATIKQRLPSNARLFIAGIPDV